MSSANKRPRPDGEDADTQIDERTEQTQAPAAEDHELEGHQQQQTQEQQDAVPAHGKDDPPTQANTSDGAAPEGCAAPQGNVGDVPWLHKVVEELLDVSVHSKLQTHFYPRIQRITSTVNAMQDEVSGVSRQAEEEYEILNADLQRLGSMVASFQMQMAQVLSPVSTSAVAATTAQGDVMNGGGQQ